MTVTQEAKLLDRASILRLPDELLDRIISMVCSMPNNDRSMRYYYGYQHSKLYEMPATLCLVCRRINRLAVAYLYADLMVGCAPNGMQAQGVPEGMHRSCRANPALWPLCRRLLIRYEEERSVRRRSQANGKMTLVSGNPFLFVATDFITWFTAAKFFTLTGLGEHEEAWELLRLALTQITELSQLSLQCGASYNLNLSRVVETITELAPRTMRALAINGVSLEEGQCWAKLRNNAGTAPFTSLKLYNFLQTPQVLEDVLRWPVKLEDFSLEHTFSCCYSVLGLCEDWSLAILQPILAIHKSTLRSIKIRCINRGGIAGFDLREFAHLETLSLSSASTSPGWDRPEADLHLVPNLLAPRLRVFHWDLALEDQQCCEGLSDFQQPEENFLRAVAQAAVDRACPLRRIEVTFTPDPGWSYRFDGLYPWDRMDALDREFRPRGIRVSYNAPSISREEYLKTLHDTLAASRPAGETDVGSV